ncbi:MBL fold metallo-hydrolase [Acetivibrio clariflavus]|uniref:Zn-dependent hydrolase, glyoxylase n=1 Tax=Acetivibrio clariflavus (strain DSM 19732 / NBRC 101661 / EBR45) TaxID=720554 RepID=G8LSI7_ACECE|nr:MBL fold metallo-hydrolase [Acetivibrio clariflavus]AEV68291.1 Zn-dependent hydrolase, glyoxylase [Acetivibrio clariflavus DSM 19732]
MIKNIIWDRLYDIFADIYIKLNFVNPIETGRITGNLFVVRTGTANFYIYKTGQYIIAFDCGYGKSQIKRELLSLGIKPEDITHLFLTHSDFDHAKGLSVFEKAEIYLSSDEEQLITGKKARKFGIIYNFRIKRRYHLLNDNDIVTVGSTKIKAIATPGHTTGSMSYLIDNEKILIIGDAFRIIKGKVYPIKLYNMDSKKHRESIRKLAYIEDVKLVCTGHRGYYDRFDDAIRHWR